MYWNSQISNLLKNPSATSRSSKAIILMYEYRWRWRRTGCTRFKRHGRGQLKCDGTRAETRFLLSAKRTSPFKSAGASVQSTTGSRCVRCSGSNAGYTMFRGIVKSTGYPHHTPVSPSLPLPCVTVCNHISTVVYYKNGTPPKNIP
jgi:hypothetical protein